MDETYRKIDPVQAEKENLLEIVSENSPDKFISFLQFLRANHPDYSYPLDEHVLKALEEGQTEVYLAQQNHRVLAGLVGSSFPEGFIVEYLVSDPDVKQSDSGKKLIDSLKHKYEKIFLLADAFGQRTTLESGRKNHRQEALIRYYSKLGFIPNPEAWYHNETRLKGESMYMVWEKPNS